MLETKVPKTWFTRRGVILGVTGLVLVLAVAAMASGLFRGNSKGTVPTKLMGFEPSRDRSSFLAVFELTNETALDLVLPEAGDGESVLGFFHSQKGNSTSELGAFAGGGVLYNRLVPRSTRVACVLLPNDGRIGRIHVRLVSIWKTPTGRLERLREWWQFDVLHTDRTPRAICGQLIQCPLLLPDGTVQPPRLLATPQTKR